MKVLRVRRGFSTNCSGANEYFPPDNILPPPVADDEDAGPSVWTLDPNAKVVFRWVTFMPDGAPPPMLKAALSAGVSDASTDGQTGEAVEADLDGGVEVPAPEAREETTRISHGRDSSSFGLILFFVLLGALALFGVERIARGLWDKLRKGRHDDAGSS